MYFFFLCITLHQIDLTLQKGYHVSDSQFNVIVWASLMHKHVVAWHDQYALHGKAYKDSSILCILVCEKMHSEQRYAKQESRHNKHSLFSEANIR